MKQDAPNRFKNLSQKRLFTDIEITTTTEANDPNNSV